MKSLKQPKVIVELGLAKGTEAMRASQMRPTSFKDKSKYSRKHKHKNRQDRNLGDYFFVISIFWREKSLQILNLSNKMLQNLCLMGVDFYTKWR